MHAQRVLAGGDGGAKKERVGSSVAVSGPGGAVSRLAGPTAAASARAASRASGRPATAPAGSAGAAGAGGAVGKASSWRSHGLRPAPLLIPDDKRARQRRSSSAAGSAGAGRVAASSARRLPSRPGGAPTRGGGGGLGAPASAAAAAAGDEVEHAGHSPEAGVATPTLVSQRKRVPFDPSTPDSLGSTVLDANSPAMFTGNSPPGLPQDVHDSPWRGQTIREEHCLLSPQHPAREAHPAEDTSPPRSSPLPPPSDTSVDLARGRGDADMPALPGNDPYSPPAGLGLVQHGQRPWTPGGSGGGGGLAAASPGMLTEVSALSRSVPSLLLPHLVHAHHTCLSYVSFIRVCHTWLAYALIHALAGAHTLQNASRLQHPAD